MTPTHILQQEERARRKALGLPEEDMNQYIDSMVTSHKYVVELPYKALDKVKKDTIKRKK